MHSFFKSPVILAGMAKVPIASFWFSVASTRRALINNPLKDPDVEFMVTEMYNRYLYLQNT